MPAASPLDTRGAIAAGRRAWHSGEVWEDALEQYLDHVKEQRGYCYSDELPEDIQGACVIFFRYGWWCEMTGSTIETEVRHG